MINKIIQGDTLSVLKTMPDNSVNCVITSPPYWGLRDYGTAGQLGLEKTFTEYIDKLCNIFNEVKRVLRDDGTCWINHGDTYSGSGKGIGTDRNKCKEVFPDNIKKTNWKNIDYPDKCLCLIPQRFQIEMVNREWICRNTLIWHKNNCMPSSVTDRFTVDFEYIFFFVKNKKYWFEQQFEPNLINENRPDGIVRDRLYDYNSKQKIITGRTAENGKGNGELSKGKRFGDTSIGRNKRCVWNINTKPYKGAHFAVFPPELPMNCIKAGCPKNGIVMDIFAGSGTTCAVAKQLGMRWIGIELNPIYIKLAEKRIEQTKEQMELL